MTYLKLGGSLGLILCGDFPAFLSMQLVLSVISLLTRAMPECGEACGNNVGDRTCLVISIYGTGKGDQVKAARFKAE